MSYSNFTSLPPEEEQSFVVFERYSREASSKAMTMGLIAGGVVGFLLIVLYFTSDPPKAMHADALDSDIPAETATKKDKPKAKPAVTKDDDDDGDDEGADEGGDDEGGDEGGAAEGGDEGGEGATEAPTPPKGATKAPPTDLVK